MIQLIVSIIFLVSFLAIAFILAKKIPVLVELPQNGHHGFKKSEFILSIEKRLKELHRDIFKKKVYLHKFLSLVKILTLKVEAKVDKTLHGIRSKAQKLDRESKK